MVALVGGVLIMGAKLGVFALTRSAAVLSDALESIINIVAACMMMYSIWLANRPADAGHPYGHGKVEFLSIGLEGGMILVAGILIVAVAVKRLVYPVELENLDWGVWSLGAVNMALVGLAGFLYYQGRKYLSSVLIADAKHLLTDAASTLAVIVGLLLVQWTGLYWVDPALALVLGGLIILTSRKLLQQSIDGLMDRSDPADQAGICRILDEEVAAGNIRSYHKVRHRHTGSFHWVDMHIQVDGQMTVNESHSLVSRIERRIEEYLGRAKATAHVEPYEDGAPGGSLPPDSSASPPPSRDDSQSS